MKNDYESLSHTKWRCQYHIVLTPKYRRQIIYGKYRAEIGKILRTICDRYGVEIIEANACKDHTLILVHRSQLMEQWKERLEQFLIVNEALPLQQKRRGRQKKREVIGLYGANKDTRSGIIDIAMLQSMDDADAIRPWLRDYGMVIVDNATMSQPSALSRY